MVQIKLEENKYYFDSDKGVFYKCLISNDKYATLAPLQMEEGFGYWTDDETVTLEQESETRGDQYLFEVKTFEEAEKLSNAYYNI